MNPLNLGTTMVKKAAAGTVDIAKTGAKVGAVGGGLYALTKAISFFATKYIGEEKLNELKSNISKHISEQFEKGIFGFLFENVSTPEKQKEKFKQFTKSIDTVVFEGKENEGHYTRTEYDVKAKRVVKTKDVEVDKETYDNNLAKVNLDGMIDTNKKLINDSIHRQNNILLKGYRTSDGLSKDINELAVNLEKQGKGLDTNKVVEAILKDDKNYIKSLYNELTDEKLKDLSLFDSFRESQVSPSIARNAANNIDISNKSRVDDINKEQEESERIWEQVDDQMS